MGATPIIEPITLYGFTPHMHLRGKDMRWVLTLPDGVEETLLNIPKYDFNWQIYYELQQPLNDPGRQHDHARRALRQHGEQPLQSGARQGSVLVGAELGRDVTAVHHLHGRQRSPQEDEAVEQPAIASAAAAIAARL